VRRGCFPPVPSTPGAEAPSATVGAATRWRGGRLCRLRRSRRPAAAALRSHPERLGQRLEGRGMSPLRAPSEPDPHPHPPAPCSGCQSDEVCEISCAACSATKWATCTRHVRATPIGRHFDHHRVRALPQATPDRDNQATRPGVMPPNPPLHPTGRTPALRADARLAGERQVVRRAGVVPRPSGPEASPDIRACRPRSTTSTSSRRTWRMRPGVSMSRTPSPTPEVGARAGKRPSAPLDGQPRGRQKNAAVSDSSAILQRQQSGGPPKPPQPQLRWAIRQE
jgi:hypothetical protein